MGIVLTLLLLGSSAHPQHRTTQDYIIKEVAHLIQQAGCPVEIRRYTVKRKTRDAVTDGIVGARITGNGVAHGVELVNPASRVVVATRFVFITYDVWDDFLHVAHTDYIWKLYKNEKRKTGWTRWQREEFPAHTGIAFIDRVRFEDGKVWKANRPLVREQITELGFRLPEGALKPRTIDHLAIQSSVR